MQQVVVGMDGLDWYQPSQIEDESWLMTCPAPLSPCTPTHG